MSNFSLPIKKSLLQYSEHLDRASIEDDAIESMPPRRRRKSGKKRFRKGKRRGIRTLKGRISIHIPGYQGLQTFSAAELITKISKAKIKAAGKILLRRSGKKKYRKGKKKRKSRRKK